MIDIVSRHDAYKAPKIGYRAVPRQSLECAGARASYGGIHPWHTVHQKILINHLRSGSLRTTLGSALAYGVCFTADYSVKQACIPLNGAVLTLGSSTMSNVVVGTVFGHHVLEVGGKISGTMPLEQIVEQDRVVCSVCRGASHKTKLSDAMQIN